MLNTTLRHGILAGPYAYLCAQPTTIVLYRLQYSTRTVLIIRPLIIQTCIAANLHGRIMHEAGEAEASGPRPR